jgi:ribose transport system permease protein
MVEHLAADSPASHTAATPTAVAMRARAQRLTRLFGVWLALALLVPISALFEPSLVSSSSLGLLARQASVIGLLAVGQTLVMLTGGIDLSVGSVVAVVNWVSTILLAGSNSRNVPVFALCLAIGAAVGTINGIGITKFRVPPFVMTLGMLFAVQAAGFIYTNGITRGEASSVLRSLGQGYVGPVPVSFIVFASVAALAQAVLLFTAYGRRLYAVGANDRAAHMTGVDVDRVRILAYVACGVIAAIAGLILSGYIGIGDNTSGKGLELDAIAAAVIGGTVLTGGRGTVFGSFGGALLLAYLYNLLVILDIAQSGRLILQGAVIVFAAAVYSRALRR